MFVNLTWVADTEESGVQGRPQLHIHFQPAWVIHKTLPLKINNKDRPLPQKHVGDVTLWLEEGRRVRFTTPEPESNSFMKEYGHQLSNEVLQPMYLKLTVSKLKTSFTLQYKLSCVHKVQIHTIIYKVKVTESSTNSNNRLQKWDKSRPWLLREKPCFQLVQLQILQPAALQTLREHPPVNSALSDPRLTSRHDYPTL